MNDLLTESRRFERLVGFIEVDGERDTTDVRSPSDGRSLGLVPICNGADVSAAVARSREAQRMWELVAVEERAEVIVAFQDLVLAHSDELLDIVQDETGKSRSSAFEELADVVMASNYYAKSAGSFLRPEQRAGAFPLLTKTMEYRKPKGVVGVISPWNYPLTLPATDSVPALLAGNGVVLKPDSQTPFTALRLFELFLEAGLPEGLLNVVTGPGPVIGPAMIDEVDFVMFTGSTATGRQVAQQCAAQLIGFSAELGGKNPLLVLADANVGRAAEGAVRACFSNAGQLCISIERIYVHDAVYDDFVQAFVENVGRMHLGVGHDWDVDMGSLTSQRQLDTVIEHVEDAVAKGAEVLAGGRARPDLGPFFHEPTVLTGVTDEMTLAQTETFGPVVAIRRVLSDHEAVELANDTDYGLSASVWSRQRGAAVARTLNAGTVNVNDGYMAGWASYDAPMGGLKDSGVGRRHGREGILKYTDAQTVAEQRLISSGPPSWMSNKQYSRALTGAVKVMNRFRY